MGQDKQKLHDRSIQALVHFLCTNFIILLCSVRIVYIFFLLTPKTLSLKVRRMHFTFEFQSKSTVPGIQLALNEHMIFLNSLYLNSLIKTKGKEMRYKLCNHNMQILMRQTWKHFLDSISIQDYYSCVQFSSVQSLSRV